MQGQHKRTRRVSHGSLQPRPSIVMDASLCNPLKPCNSHHHKHHSCLPSCLSALALLFLPCCRHTRALCMSCTCAVMLDDGQVQHVNLQQQAYKLVDRPPRPPATRKSATPTPPPVPAPGSKVPKSEPSSSRPRVSDPQHTAAPPASDPQHTAGRVYCIQM